MPSGSPSAIAACLFFAVAVHLVARVEPGTIQPTACRPSSWGEWQVVGFVHVSSSRSSAKCSDERRLLQYRRMSNVSSLPPNCRQHATVERETKTECPPTRHEKVNALRRLLGDSLQQSITEVDDDDDDDTTHIRPAGGSHIQRGRTGTSTGALLRPVGAAGSLQQFQRQPVWSSYHRLRVGNLGGPSHMLLASPPLWYQPTKRPSRPTVCPREELEELGSAAAGDLEPCGYDRPRDMCIILDSSGSVGQRNFAKAVKCIAKLVGLMCNDFSCNASRPHTRISVITYGSQPVTVFDFSHSAEHHHSTATLIKDIRTKSTYLDHYDSATATGPALEHARDHIFKSCRGMRKESKKLILLLTDGKSNRGKAPGPVARTLHHSDLHVDVIALGIGSGVNVAELHDITNTGTHNMLQNLLYSDFTELCDVTSTVAQEAKHSDNQCVTSSTLFDRK